MRVGTLNAIMKIAGRISNQSSLSSLYRSVELGPEEVRVMSEFGAAEISVDPTGLAEPSLLDTVSVVAVSSSLPVDADIKMERKNGEVKWSCGTAKGKWNIIQTEHMPDRLNHTSFPWQPAVTFPDALRLASSACSSAAVSFGLYGIEIKPEGDKLRLLSSNQIALAEATIEKGTYPAGSVTIRPPVLGILALLLDSCPNCLVDITENGIFIQGDWLKACVPLGVALEHNLAAIADQFVKQEHKARINGSAVKKFITRCKILSERNTNLMVGMRVDDGKLALEYKGMAAETEEYFLADGLDEKDTFQTVSLPAELLAIPLEHAEAVVLDYLPEQRLLITGSQPDFKFILSGQ